MRGRTTRVSVQIRHYNKTVSKYSKLQSGITITTA